MVSKRQAAWGESMREAGAAAEVDMVVWDCEAIYWAKVQWWQVPLRLTGCAVRGVG